MRKVFLLLVLTVISCKKEEIKPNGTHASLESKQEQLINKK